MTDNKNTIIAIVLSAIVLIGWQYFVGMPQMEKQRIEAQQKQQQQQQQQTTAPGTPGTAPLPGAPGAPAPSGTAPTPGQPSAPAAPGSTAPAAQAQTREAVLAAHPRITVETPRIKGSIALKGARIDDLALIQYRETVDPKSPPILLLSPSGTANPFYAEFGWVRGQGSTAKLPDADTVWTQLGTGPLTPGKPVTLTWDNGEGLLFRRTIAVDDKYLFTAKDEVTNKGTEPVTLFPYALISRHGMPKTEGYYILHEGFIGVLGDQGLKEESYKTVEDKKAITFPKTANGWLGITDKYWAATLLPDATAPLQPRFSSGTAGAQKTYQTDYLLDAQTIQPGGTGTATSAAVRRREGSRRRRRLRQDARAEPLRAADRLGLVLFHHQADVQGDRLLLPLDRQFRPRDPDRHRPDQDPVLPARQQVLRLDGEDEGGAAGDDGDPRALRRRQGEAAAGADGAVQEGEDQSARGLSSDPRADPGVLRALQGAVRHHRDAPRAVHRLDPRPLGARPDQLVQPVRADPVRPDR